MTIQDNIESHKKLFATNVTLEHVLEAHEFRRRVLDKFADDEIAQAGIQLKVLSERLSSPWCKSKLQSSIGLSSAHSGRWLFEDRIFKTWLASFKGPMGRRCFWVRGNPGAGEYTFIESSCINIPIAPGLITCEII